MTNNDNIDIKKYKGVWVFTEIKDHEKVLDCSLELLTKGRELSEKLSEKLYSIVFGLNCEQYLPTIKKYGPDIILYSTRDDKTLKHYNNEIFVDLFQKLIDKYKPSIILFPSTEAGNDLSARLAQKFSTGLTAHCSDLDIIYYDDLKSNILLMKRPAFSGNVTATILCPKRRPQMATVQQGVFKKNGIKIHFLN